MFSLVEKTVPKQSGKAALDTGTDGELSGEAAETAMKVGLFGAGSGDCEPALVSAGCATAVALHGFRCVLFLGSLCQDAKFAGLPSRSPEHFCSEPYKSKTRETDVELLCIPDACACSVVTAPSKTKHSNTGPEVPAAMKFQKGELIGSHYGKLIFPKLSSEKHTKQVFGSEALTVNMARISKYLLSFQVQERQLEDATERLRNKQAVRVN